MHQSDKVLITPALKESASILTITTSIATSLVITMSSLEVYMRESREMGNRLGMFSAEYQRFRDWWALNMDKASETEVQRMAADIWRQSGRSCGL